MNKVALFFTNISCLFLVSASLIAQDAKAETPTASIQAKKGFERVRDVAQYKGADWSNMITIVRSIRLPAAFDFAKNDPNITYFFYTKGPQMVLESPDGSMRVFRQGDAVFFSGEPHWGDAHDLADGYIKK